MKSSIDSSKTAKNAENLRTNKSFEAIGNCPKGHTYLRREALQEINYLEQWETVVSGLNLSPIPTQDNWIIVWGGYNQNTGFLSLKL